MVTWKDVTAGLEAHAGAIRKVVPQDHQAIHSTAVSNQQLAYSTQAQGVSFKCTGGSDMMAGLANPNRDSDTIAVSGNSNGINAEYRTIEFGLYCTRGTCAADGGWPIDHPLGPSACDGGSGEISIVELQPDWNAQHPGRDFESRIITSWTYAGTSYGGSLASNNIGWTYADTFTVQVVGNEVMYLKNGVPFHKSAMIPTFPLQVDISLSNIKGALSEVELHTAAATSTPVTWTSGAGVADEPGSLEKISGSVVDFDAGAISKQQISFPSTTPQGVSFSCIPGSSALAGLGHNDTSQHYRDIDFAIMCGSNGGVSVYESTKNDPDSSSKVYESIQGGTDQGYTADDVIKVQVTGTVVQYLLNDEVIYTSAKLATFPLRVDTSIDNVGSRLTNVAIFTNTPGTARSARGYFYSPGGHPGTQPFRSCGAFKAAHPALDFAGLSGEHQLTYGTGQGSAYCDFDTDTTKAYTTIMQAGGGASGSDYFTTGATGGTPGNVLSPYTSKLSDADINAICFAGGGPAVFKWDVRTTDWTERLYMRLAAGQAYSTTGVIQKSCRADPAESWSIDYAGSKDFGLANRGYPEQYPTPSGGNVFCCPKTVRGSGSDVGTSNCGTHYGDWVGVWAMRFELEDSDVCGRGADGGASTLTSRCDATKNAFISCE
jgi:hypothetical protein